MEKGKPLVNDDEYISVAAEYLDAELKRAGVSDADGSRAILSSTLAGDPWPLAFELAFDSDFARRYKGLDDAKIVESLGKDLVPEKSEAEERLLTFLSANQGDWPVAARRTLQRFLKNRSEQSESDQSQS